MGRHVLVPLPVGCLVNVLRVALFAHTTSRSVWCVGAGLIWREARPGDERNVASVLGQEVVQWISWQLRCAVRCADVVSDVSRVCVESGPPCMLWHARANVII